MTKIERGKIMAVEKNKRKHGKLGWRFFEALSQEYEIVKSRYLAIGHILAIKDCATEVFTMSNEEKLKTCGLTACSTIEYTSDSYDKNSQADQIGGQHFGVMTSIGRLSV